MNRFGPNIKKGEKIKFCFKCFEKQPHKFHHKKIEWKMYDDYSSEQVKVRWYKCKVCGELAVESSNV
ncbi:MAG TPA: hypothetical protein DCS93_01675 [Microscillaceae bacterium]|nr:hypothetical protein [Microscillaceae bacterium]